MATAEGSLSRLYVQRASAIGDMFEPITRVACVVVDGDGDIFRGKWGRCFVCLTKGLETGLPTASSERKVYVPYCL
jgi:hypothetical protein